METIETPRALRGPVRILTIALGGFFVGLAWLGFVLPGLPGTPFLLLASYCWVRSSPRLHRWLLGSRLFGPMLRDWRAHRAVRPGVKKTAAITMLMVVSISLAFGRFRGWALFSLVGLSLVGLTVILCLPVITDESSGSDEGSPS